MTKKFLKGDVITGEKLILTARKLSKIRIVNATGTHKAQEISGSGSAFCFIDRPIKSVARKNPSS